MARFFGTGSIVIFVIGLVLLLPSFIFLSVEKGNLEDEVVIEKVLAKRLKLQEVSSNVTQIQALLSEAQTFLNRPSRASQITKIFFADAPGVRVQALSVTTAGEVALSGFAQTRDDLLNFQKQLQGSHMLETLTFPISDIIHSTNIQFTLTGKLKAGQGLY